MACSFLCAFNLLETIVPISTTGAAVVSKTLSGSEESLGSGAMGSVGAGRASRSPTWLARVFRSIGFGLSLLISSNFSGGSSVISPYHTY